MSNSLKYTRIGYIDIFRSIGIILMIMGHIGFGERFDFFIHAFHMPMFFIISGFLYNPKSKEEVSIKERVIRKSKSLLLPYFVFGIGYYLIYLGLGIIRDNPITLNPLMHLLFVNTTGLYICGALWFLTALFFTDIIFFAIDKYIDNQTTKVIVIAAIAILGNLSKDVLPFTLPFALSASFVGVGLYSIGYLMKQNSDNKVIYCLMNFKCWQLVLIGIVVVFLIFSNGYINMRKGEYSTIPLFWINAFLSTLVILNFSRLIYPLIANKPIGKWLSGVGKDSMVYLCLNELVITVIELFASNLLSMPVLISKMLILVLTMLILFALNKIITRTRLRLIIGR